MCIYKKIVFGTIAEQILFLTKGNTFAGVMLLTDCFLLWTDIKETKGIDLCSEVAFVLQ